jgi:GT2 family glycosyltransferase
LAGEEHYPRLTVAVQHQGTSVGAPEPTSGATAGDASADEEIDSIAHAPPVVAVVVTHDPGPWLEECLASFGAQDYPNLSVLVVDAASSVDPLPRIAAALPDAYVRHLATNAGFGAAANEVLAVVEGASFYAFCHDDVLLDPSAIRALVEEAFRSNAGVVGPKLVQWGRPEALLQVGLSADKTGVLTPLVERGELDQEQHDRVRDVFAIPGACTLVRTDLFASLGGFDPAITYLGDDLDLCWRAHVAGARVVVVPAARVQHREELQARRGVDDRRRLFARHRLRTMLTCYGPFHLVRVLPQAALFTLIEVLYALAAGRMAQSAEVLGAWSWNARRLGEIRRRRRALRAVRGLRDREIRRLQGRGSARLTSFLRGELGRGDRVRTSLAEAGRDLAGSLQAGPRRVAIVACVVVAVMVAVGTRELVGERLPAFAGLAEFDRGPFSLLGEYARGWRSAGLGSEAPAPTAFALLGLAGTVLVGGMGLLQQILVLGCLPAGLVGAWRLTRFLGSPRARAVGLVVYAVAPLPYDALARGRWDGLILYAAAPWVLSRLLAATGEAPFERRKGDGDRPNVWPTLSLGILLAVVAAFVPLVVFFVPVIALALVLGSLLTRGGWGTFRALGIACGASVVALVLHLPWSLSFLPVSGGWAAMAGVGALGGTDLGVGALLRLETGTVGLSALGWAVPVAGALALFIGRGWRLAWAVRAWTVAVVCWALVWAGGRGLTGLPMPAPEVLVAPAAAALALAAALGMVAFERDLSGYGFGLRQVASLIAAGAVVVATVPVAVTAIDGDWGVPDSDFTRTLSFMEDDEVAAAGAFRVLWLGAPEVLPVAGHTVGDGVAYGLSDNGPPGIDDRWATPSGANDLVGEALRLAADGRSERLGRLLGPLGIRYLVLAERSAPARSETAVRLAPEGVAATLNQQLDLRRIDVDPALGIYENDAWVPVRSSLAAAGAADVSAAVSAPEPFPATVGLDLSPSSPVLDGSTSGVRFRGDVPAGTLYVAEAASPRWQLESGGEVAPRSTAFGWANAFAVDEPGEARLRYRTSPVRWLAVAGQALVWLLALSALARLRRRATVPRP